MLYSLADVIKAEETLKNILTLEGIPRDYPLPIAVVMEDIVKILRGELKSPTINPGTMTLGYPPHRSY